MKQNIDGHLERIFESTIKQEHKNFCDIINIGRVAYEVLGYDKQDILEAMNFTLAKLWKEHNQDFKAEEDSLRVAVEEKIAILNLIFGD